MSDNIDAIKIVLEFCELAKRQQGISRFSLLDLTIFLLIKENPKSSKVDLIKIFYGEHIKPASFDKPIARLLQNGLIVKEVSMTNASKLGEGRVFYFLSKKGEKLISRCKND